MVSSSLPGGAGRKNMTDDQMTQLRQHFETIDQHFETIDQQFAGLRSRFDDLDAEVHRQGIRLESNANELKLAIESFQGLQRVTNAKIDDLRERVDQRIAPLEAAVRAHSQQLAEHARRLDERGQ
jgi:chaperonin cofactor prefoldin